MRRRGSRLLLPALALLLVPALSGTGGRTDPGHPAARAPAARLRAGGVGEPERRLGLPVRPRRRGRRRALVRERPRRLPADDPRPFPVGVRAVRGEGRGRRRVVRAARAGAGELEGEEGLPRGRRLRLEDERVAGRGAGRRTPGGLHALRAGPDQGREAGHGPEAGPPRGRHAASLQAGGQARLREGQGPLADDLPRGPAGRLPGGGRVPPRPGPEAGRGAGEALLSGARGGGRGAGGPDGRPRRSLCLGGAGAGGGRRARGPPDPPPRGATAPVVARGPLPLRRDGHAHRREGRGPRALVLRPAKDRCREAARARPPVRVAEREARLPPDDPRPVLEPRRLLDLAHRRGDARGGPDREAAGPQRDPHPREGRDPPQALLGGPAGGPGHGGRAEQLGRAGRGDEGGVGDGLPRHGAPRLQPPVDLLVGPLQRAVGPPDEGRGREGGVPARDAGVGRDAGGPGEAARPDAARRGQLALLRRGAREDRPQLLAHVPAGVEVEGRPSTRPRRRPSPARPGTTWAAARRAASPCSTASAATCGATRARRGTWTGASTTTR